MPINQQLYGDSYNITRTYFVSVFSYLKELVKTHKIADVDFIIYGKDDITENNGIDAEIMKIPAFMMSKDISLPQEKDKLLFPDAYILSSKWSKLIDKITKASEKNTWDSKIDKIFWSGVNSGGFYNLNNFSKLPRLSLVMLSKLYPNLIDARFSSFKGSDGLQSAMKLLFKDEFKPVSEIDHLKYKYLISVDGNTCAWLRIPWIMLSNSLLIKQESTKIEWFYPAIKPYIHYVPVNYNLANIFSQLEWIKTHEDQVKKISHNAHEFIISNLMPEHINSHVVIILNEYAKLQQDETIVSTLPSADKIYTVAFLVQRFMILVKDSIMDLF